MTAERTTIILNGEPFEIEPGTTVQGLIEKLSLRPSRIAVEVNHAVVSKQAYPATILHPNDRVEIVNFVGGG